MNSAHIHLLSCLPLPDGLKFVDLLLYSQLRDTRQKAVGAAARRLERTRRAWELHTPHRTCVDSCRVPARFASY